MGWHYGANGLADTSNVAILLEGLSSRFWLNPVLLLPVFVMGILIYKKVPAILTMCAAILMGMFFACTQSSSFSAIADALVNGFKAESGIAAVDSMLAKGGINAMRNTVYILILGLPMGGILKETHTMEIIVFHFKSIVRSRVSVITGSLITVMAMAAICGDTYAAYILTCSAFGAAHDRLQLDRKVLSRSCEMGVVCCCLMGWTSGGAYMSGLFGVSPLEYMPYYYWGYLIFAFNIICAITGYGIFYKGGRRGWGRDKEIPPVLELAEAGA